MVCQTGYIQITYLNYCNYLEEYQKKELNLLQIRKNITQIIYKFEINQNARAAY